MKRGLPHGIVVFCAALLVGGAADAAELRLLCATGVAVVIEDLAPKFERATGHRLAITFDNLGGLVRRVRAGEAADLIIIPQQGLASLWPGGAPATAGATPIAESQLGLAIRKGAARPDISSPDALRRALLAAHSITYSNPAGGGAAPIQFVKVLERLGIADEMKPKTRYPRRPGFAGFGLEVVEGEVDYAINQLQELMVIDGLDVVGPLPGELQTPIAFAAALMDGARQVDAAQALVRFLRSPEASAVMRSKGMLPATP